MFYEEQIIDGILCYRTTPKGEFVPMSAVQLTTRVLELRRQLETWEQPKVPSP
jgi:hypothetical protein